MSTTNKTVLGIVIVAVIALIAAFALRTHAPSQTAANGSDNAALPTAATDTSDAALQKDSAAIDAQMSGLDQDTATVDQGLSEAQQ